MTYRTPSFVHLLRRARRLLGTALAAALTLLLVPLGQPAAHAVTAVSPGAAPFGPANTVIPNWYADAAGVRLQPCAAGLPLCPFAPADFAPSGGEAFYYRATSTLSTAPPPGIPAVKSVFVAGLEAAFVPAPLSIFERMRIRVQVPQTGTYTVTYPYGVKTYNVGVLGAAAEINDTVDTGCLGACTTAAQFALAAPVGQGLNSVEPFLQLAPGVVPTAGFLSTGVANPVVGSPLGTNFFRVEGSGINPGTDPTAACPAPLTGPNCIQQNNFLVQGQLAPGLTAAPTSLSFPNQAMGTTSAPQTVTVTNSTAAGLPVTSALAGAQAAQFTATPGATPCPVAPATLAPAASCTIKVTWASPATQGTSSAAVLTITGDPAGPINVALTGSTPEAAPTASPAPGTFSSAQSVTLSATDPPAPRPGPAAPAPACTGSRACAQPRDQPHQPPAPHGQRLLAGCLRRWCLQLR